MVLQEDVEAYASWFQGRTDARGTIDGGCTRELITLQHYRSHLEGKGSLGVYPLLDGNVVRFSAADIDVTDILVAKRVHQALHDVDIPSYIALSKRGRFHVYTFYIESVPAAKVREVYSRIQQKLGIEFEIFPKQDTLPPGGLGNYINLPYFGNTRPFLAFDKDDKPHPVSLSFFLDHVKVVIEEQLDHALTQLSPVVVSTKEPPGPGWVANLLNNPIRFGERDNSATRIAGFFHTKGLPRDVTLAILKNALVVEKGEHPFTIEDIRKCVESVYKYPEKERRVLDLVSLPTLLRAEDNNVAEVVSGILPKAGVCIVAGEPGTGKTWLVLALARDVATGKPFLGKFAAEQGSVLVIDEESGKYRLQKRMQKLGVTENLPIAFSIMKVINLSDPSWEEPLREVIAQQKPELVVLDSLVRIHRGDENQSTEMAKLFATLTKFREEFGCAFVITHHLRKRVQQSKLNTLEQRLRGSSDIAAYADTVLGLDRVDDRLVFSQLKNRDGEFFKPLALGIDDISDDRTEIVVLAEVDEEADKRKLARELVRKALREKPTLREELVTLAKGENIGERTLVDALKSLMDAGEIIRNMEGRKSSYRLKQPTQLTQ